MKRTIYFLSLIILIFLNASDSAEIQKTEFRANALCQEANCSNEFAACCFGTACIASIAICCPNTAGVLQELPEVTPTCINYTCLVSSVGALYHWFRSSVLSNRSDVLHEIVANARRLDRPVEIRDGLTRHNLDDPDQDFELL
ncbi:hypothetical protein A3F66_04080 [candidate division TM6 bacterium RIFCSPHIGHO2_12_FULL_32_22]|nr:MAG: hypothetical protein A3F66_04080 [candidate division TM6 bacterium RIFCSPHIGHO2_12_FULL_32_22]